MAIGALVAGGIGLASVAGGIGAARSAAKEKTQARGVTYAGSQEAQDRLKNQFAAGAQQGNTGYSMGTAGLQQAARSGEDLSAQGQGLIRQGQNLTGVTAQNAGGAILAGYQPGQVSAAQSQATIDAGAQANLGAARSGGALGLRNALNANAFANVNAAQNMAAQRAQEQQAYVGAQVQQANQNQQDQFQASQQLQAQRLGLMGLGSQLATTGNSQAASAYGNVGQLGLGNQGQFLGQQQNVYDTQTELDLDLEKRRQAEAQRRSNNKWGLASSLISGGMASMQGAAKGM